MLEIGCIRSSLYLGPRFLSLLRWISSFLPKPCLTCNISLLQWHSRTQPDQADTPPPAVEIFHFFYLLFLTTPHGLFLAPCTPLLMSTLLAGRKLTSFQPLPPLSTWEISSLMFMSTARCFLNSPGASALVNISATISAVAQCCTSSSPFLISATM